MGDTNGWGKIRLRDGGGTNEKGNIRLTGSGDISLAGSADIRLTGSGDTS